MYMMQTLQAVKSGKPPTLQSKSETKSDSRWKLHTTLTTYGAELDTGADEFLSAMHRHTFASLSK